MKAARDRSHPSRRGVTCGIPLLLACALFPPATASQEQVTLANAHIRATFGKADGAWRLTSVARKDGSDSLAVKSDEFEILLFNGSRYTVADYAPRSRPTRSREGGREMVRIEYGRKPDMPPSAPPGWPSCCPGRR